MKDLTMKNFKIIATAAACVLITTSSFAGAATLSGGFSTPNPVKITAPNQIMTIKHTLGVSYYNNEKFACGAKIEYGNGDAAENISIKYPTAEIVRTKTYNKPGPFHVNMSGFAHSGLVACLGSATTTVIIENGIPLPAKSGGIKAMEAPAGQPVLPINSKAKLVQVVLKKNEFSPGAAWLYSTIYLNKADPNCLVDFTVTTTNTGSNAINLELMKTSFGGVWATASTEYNPGTLNLTSTGKYRVTVKARTDVADNHCTGSVSTDFEVKRMKLFGAAAPTPNPTYGSMITKITSVNKPGAWDITVHGSGDKDCKYHVNLWSLPEMSIFKSEAMTYKKNAMATMTIPKPVPGKGVRVEVMEENDDVVDNKGCLGRPTLDLQVALPPKGKTDLGDTIKPKKGLITALTISKKTFALGETIPALLKVQGDSCYFIYKVRKLPWIGPDVVFDAKADPLKVNDWNLNNLGDTLTAGNWEVFMQASPGPFPPGEVSCEIAPGQGTQVLFTVTP
ncbi:hypothetical protein BH11PSE12_BH11PSE12_34540 [soil metagenome]